MEFKKFRLAIVSDERDRDAVKFEGQPLGRSLDKPVDMDSYKTSVEIYQTREEKFIVYIAYRDKDGEISLADFVQTESLDPSTVRNALKEADIYPGPMYSEAIHHSFDTLELLA